MTTHSEPSGYPYLVTSLDDISSREFDYVVVGAGTSGLALACRLAEDPTITIAVLEAGGHNHELPVISRSGQFGPQIGVADIIQMDQTVPQSQLHDRTLFWPRGKVVGGSSAVNFYIFQKPPAKDIDNWEKLGSPGWSWNSYHDALKRAETFHPPSDADRTKFKYEFDPNSHGSNGPIHTSFPKIQTAGEERFLKAMVELGVPITKDPAGGNVLGLGSFVCTIDPRTNTRSHSALGYFVNASPKPNLKLLTRATARKVLFRKRDGQDVSITASGVEFEHEGSIHVVHAKREVILSAGTLRSSALLELSGIGDKSILEPLGIEVEVHNPSVGENLQEHVNVALNWYIDTEKFPLETIDLLHDPAFFKKQEELYSKGKGVYLASPSLCAWLPHSQIVESERFAEVMRIAEDGIKGSGADRLAAQHKLQLEDLQDQNHPDMEIIFVPFFYTPPSGSFQPGKAGVAVVCGLNHPFSRGAIHINSSNPRNMPIMNPDIYGSSVDLEIMLDAMKYARKIAAISSFQEMTIEEASPGPDVVSDDDLRDYLRGNTGTTFHTAGTCAMLPRDQGGVVDPSLKVYGTTNLRVCDLSIVPLHIAAHTQATAYAIAEHLAAMMKG